MKQLPKAVLFSKNTYSTKVAMSSNFVQHLQRHGWHWCLLLAICVSNGTIQAQGTRLLRQPTISEQNIAFIYGGDLWITGRNGGEARRLSSTPAQESDPHFSPDGRWIAFTSDRSGSGCVYVVSSEGGTPNRLTWHASPAFARGWTNDGKRVLYASSRETAPSAFNRLWTISTQGGPSTLLPAPWGFDGAYAPDSKRMAIDRMSRWDVEWRDYRGGQNTPLSILNLEDLSETQIPCERSTDTQPLWLGNAIYFLSDRDWTVNIWAYTPGTAALAQRTKFKGTNVKWLSGVGNRLVFEQDGYLHTMDISNGNTKQLEITVRGDFPWAETKWENVNKRVNNVALSPTGKRVAMEARGEIFTVPVANGDTRNLTRSSGAADRVPIWSPDGTKVAWFSDASGEGYALMIGSQDGLTAPRSIPIGESKMAWEPTWSPDGKRIAFGDDDVRIRVLEVESGKITTADVGGSNIERGSLGLCWSPDSKWLAYAKTASNNFRRVMLWSVTTGETRALTDPLADSFAPAWDRNGRNLYFLASTDVALGSGWANTSSTQANPAYGAYVVVLRKDDPSPFPPKSDEEPDTTGNSKKALKPEKKPAKDTVELLRIDWDRIDRRTLALPMPVRNYASMQSGPKGTVFIAEEVPNNPGMVLHKFSLEDRKPAEFARGIQRMSVSADGEKILLQSGGSWRVVATAKAPSPGEGGLNITLRMQLDRMAEWQQIFNETWRYERDYFYDPNMHGRDWLEVKKRYAPLIPFVRHRSDLNYILDQVNGELSVGHSFVRGGDIPTVDTVRAGLLGADLALENGRWRIKRIYTTESWNPGLKAPLDRPNLKVEEGNYVLAVDGIEITATDDPYRLLDGTAGRQTVLLINDRPTMEGAWKAIVEPIANENALRQRAWVEDNRRKVDELSGGRLAYIWVPNTGEPGLVSFNRYFFAQQDKEGAVIDERFNGGGLLDDYMVDLMTRKLRAALTNEVPNGVPSRLPAGILGPKVLLINELAGSGGDFFPWVFRHQQAGPLIGVRTWGGLVKSSVHYALIDGGTVTAPDNAIFDPNAKRWVAENEGIPPDVEVQITARSTADGHDLQLERAVQETLDLLKKQGPIKVTVPPYSKPAKH
jgi:tricorn protease